MNYDINEKSYLRRELLMDIIQKNGNIVLKNIKDFVPKHIFECGQCFRWDLEEDGSYTGVVYDKVINVSLEDEDVILKNTNVDDVENIWINYFDLDKDYGHIKKELSDIDDYLKESTKFGYGIRILKQPFYEMVISFIISARNAIPMIKRSVNKLSEDLGEHIDTYNGKKYYSFPTVKSLANANIETITASKVAFRAPYIQKTAKMIVNENIQEKDFEKLTLDETAEKLTKFAGVGAKVADCIALFGLSKYDAFPVDVWVKRVMEEFYLKDTNMSLPKMRKYSIEKFGSLGGYAQQYLFYYAREKGIGKNK